MEFVQEDYSEDQDEEAAERETSNFFPCDYRLQQDCSPTSSSSRSATQLMNLSLAGCGSDAAAVQEEREHMFDKVVTPSDVGKLNRLVIPKQHAEKYFPLDSTTHDKGLLLNFEDRSGKPWRFRYSYWNSSQSYVMTKGWSRFVKDKKLDAGDIVSFHRGLGDHAKDRLFIDWRPRPQPPFPASNLRWAPARLYSMPSHHYYQPPPHLTYNYNYHNHPYHRHLSFAASAPEPVYYPRSSDQSIMQQRGHVPLVIDSVPLLHGRSTVAAAAGVGKNKLRLFGVNMECGMAAADEDPNSRLPSSLPHVATSASTSPQFSEKGKSSLSFDFHLSN